MYRVGVYGDANVIANMLSQSDFLPLDVDARFVGVPIDSLVHYKRACNTMERQLEIRGNDPRYFVEYKPSTELQEKYDRYWLFVFNILKFA